MNKYVKSRVIVTLKCPRYCIYCVNKHKGIVEQAKVIKSFEEIQISDEIIITGGEPMSYNNAAKTIWCLTWLNEIQPESKKILYSANYSWNWLMLIIGLVSGIHFTVHDNCNTKDQEDLLKLQNDICSIGLKKLKTSNWLSLGKNISRSIRIIPYLWNNIKIKNWLLEGECKVPDDETLYILESAKKGE